MTIVAFTQGLVLADSRRAGPDGLYNRPGKIHTYTKPVKMRSVKHGFKDTFYGFAGSGEDEAIQAAGTRAVIGQLDLWLEGYAQADQMRLLTDQTTFSIMLFGFNGLVLAELISGQVNMGYYTYLEYSRCATGSGCAAFNRIMIENKDSACPVRALYAVQAMEPTCGGEIEVWALPTVERGPEAKLRKLGSHPELNTTGCFKMAAYPKKFHYLKESKAWLTALITRSLESSAKRSKAKTSPPPQGLLDLLYSRSGKR